MRILLFILIITSCGTYAAVTPWLDFELDNGHIKIPVTVSGIEAKAILDSGAQINAINQSFINKHKLKYGSGQKVIIKGVYGQEKKSTYNNVPTELFGTQFKLDSLVSSRLGNANNALLIGGGFFNKFIVQIDYPNKKMRLLTRDAVNLKKLKNIEMKAHRETGMPIVKVNLNNEKNVWLLLDTGNSGGLFLKRSIATGNGWLEKYSAEGSVAMGVNTFGINETFHLPSLKFGPFELENILTSVPAEGQKTQNFSSNNGSISRIKGKNIKGLLGYDILKHFLITLDYKGGKMHVGLPQ